MILLLNRARYWRKGLRKKRIFGIIEISSKLLCGESSSGTSVFYAEMFSEALAAAREVVAVQEQYFPLPQNRK